MSGDIRPATPMSRQIAEHRSLLVRTLALPRPVLMIISLLFAGFIISQVLVGYLVISGELDGKWYDIRDLGNAMVSLDGVIRNSEMDSRISSALAYLVPTLLGATGIVSVVGGWLLIGPWVERRLIAKFQIRQGPNRTGPFGLLQTLAVL